MSPNQLLAIACLLVLALILQLREARRTHTQRKKQEAFMAALDDRISALKALVPNVQSTISDLRTQAAQGATADQLAQLDGVISDIVTSIAPPAPPAAPPAT